MNIYYHGADGSARRFAEEMTASGTVDAIRAEPGNLRYEYFVPLAGGETVLLIDSWEDQQALDAHHASPMMTAIAALREKHDVRMTVERYVTDEGRGGAAPRAGGGVARAAPPNCFLWVVWVIAPRPPRPSRELFP